MTMRQGVSTAEARALPTGTVSFLFTDIQVSTQLFQLYPDEYRHAVRRHHDLLLEAVESSGGVVFETVGDAVYGAFPSPGDVVRAAVAGQLALAREEWGVTGPIKVRMGIHLGEVELQGRHYFGMPLYRCARIMAAAHGGQIVLSEAAAKIVVAAPPEGVALLDLGAHRLKDLQQPEHIFQAVHGGLEAEFPPLRALGSRPHNLPAQPHPLIGRVREVEEAKARLLSDGVRMLTLTGPGGTGKTRLSLQVAAEALDAFLDGGYFVALAPVTDAALVLPTIAQTLGVQELPGQTVLAGLTTYLRDRNLLLVLDNFEQVVGAGGEVADLLVGCPKLKVLVSSRVLLRVYGEHEYPVAPLDLPEVDAQPSAETLTAYESVRLFMERGRAARPEFTLTDENASAVAEICRRLDGLPLAIELAAARVKLFGPEALLARMGNRLALLTGGAHNVPERQRTLRGAIAWSHELLGSAEQALFRRLAVFVGGCTHEAAEAVCALEDGVNALESLASLVDSSLLKVEQQPSGEPRFVMLETIREFAAERLDASDERETCRERHTAFFIRLLDAADASNFSDDRFATFPQLNSEQENLRAVLTRSSAEQRAVDGLRLLGRCWPWWWAAMLAEARRWLTTVLSQPEAQIRNDVRARALFAATMASWGQGDYAAMAGIAAECEAICRETGETVLLSRVLAMRTVVSLGDPAAGVRMHAEAVRLAAEVRDVWSVGWAHLSGGGLLRMVGDHAGAGSLLEEAQARFRQARDSWLEGLAFMQLGLLALDQEALPAAAARLERARTLALVQSGDRKNGATIVAALASIARLQGDAPRAESLFREAVVLCRDVGDAGTMPACLEGLTHAALVAGHPGRAAVLLGGVKRVAETGALSILPMNEGLYLATSGRVRERLEDRFDAAWAAGYEMAAEDLVRFALSTSPAAE